LKINFFEKLIGSGFYTGYSPYISGTVGSLAALIIYLIPGFEQLSIIIPAIIIFMVMEYMLGLNSKLNTEKILLNVQLMKLLVCGFRSLLYQKQSGLLQHLLFFGESWI